MANLTVGAHPLPERIATLIEILLASVPDPLQAQRFLTRLRNESPAAFERFASSPAALRYAIVTFSYSSFLAETILRYPEWLLQVAATGDLHRVLSAEEFSARLIQFLGAEASAPPSPLALARFRRRSLLRILLRDVLGMGTLSDIAEELSNLSDAILECAYQGIRRELSDRHGVPTYEGPDGKRRECGFAVIALGKLGGKELNYSSDIDLMFLYSANGHTDGKDRVANKEFFKKLANLYTELLSTYTAEGFCYRVDLRLRPDGRLGEICLSLDGARDYYKKRGRDWELQMLIKARVCAGDRELGRGLLDFVEPMIYSTTTDFGAIESVSGTRERISEKLGAKQRKSAASSQSGLDIKLSPGGIRDIEFLVQCLQRLHGGREPWVRHGGTLFALFRLRDKHLLSGVEYSRLASAYEFLRNLEHRLQFEEDRQTHTLPPATDLEAIALIARKMPAARAGEVATAAHLQEQLHTHLKDVRDLYDRVIGAQRPLYYGTSAVEIPIEAANIAAPSTLAPSNLAKFLDERAPHVAAAVARANPRRSRDRFERFLENVDANPEVLFRLDNDPSLVESAIDVFEHSQYFGDQLVRNPEFVSELAPHPDSDNLIAQAQSAHDAGEMRRLFRRAMLRIQGESIFFGRCPYLRPSERPPIWPTP